MPIGPDGWFDGGKPIKVEGGIRAKSRRGQIGSAWWSRRFIDILEGICAPGRLERGRRYARAGQVLGFEIAPGSVTARVQGSRAEPYTVKITISRYDESAWSRIEETLANAALYRAKLLAGEMPVEIVAVFDDLGLPLFPTDLDMSCSCPDWGKPCKHVSATLYLLAEAFDDDPFLVLAWRGRDRETLLAGLRGAGVEADEPPVDPLAVPDEPLEDRLADFYTPAVSLARLRELPGGSMRALPGGSAQALPVGGGSGPPELLLRALDPPPVKVRHIPLVDLLRPAYRALAEAERPADRAV